MEEKISEKKLSRRSFLKIGGLGAAALAVAGAGVSARPKPAKAAIKGTKLGMVIDLQKCAGCGACHVACKNENNVQTGFRWANWISETRGKFPNTTYDFVPTLCNQCEVAPCIKICPTQAPYKGEGNITMLDTDKCIGTRLCIAACPYGAISFNEQETYRFWRNNEPLIEGGTSSPEEVTRKVKGKEIPYYNPEREGSSTQPALRKKNVAEKCTLCDHRLAVGKIPYCVEACPTGARVFGDLDDPSSEASQLLKKYESFRLRESLGTQPKVFYVRKFSKRSA